MTDCLVVFVTVGSTLEGERLARKLVEERLAACVNIVPNLRSFFWWEGSLTEEGEALLLIKTTRERLDELTARVKRLHSYSVPEIIALPVMGGSTEYMDWVRAETAPERQSR